MSASLTCIPYTGQLSRTDEWERKPYDLRQVLRPAVALRDRRVLVAEQSCNGAANDVAATNDDGICAGNGYTGGLEQLDNTGRGARLEDRVRGAGREVADVVRVEAVRLSVYR